MLVYQTCWLSMDRVPRMPSLTANNVYKVHSASGSSQYFVMYHGTTQMNAQSILRNGFRRSTDGMLGPGVYLSRDLEKARRYPFGHPESDKVVLKVKVRVGKVKAIRSVDHPLRKTWHEHGYNTAWVPPKCGMVLSGLEENCVWDPRRIELPAILHSNTYVMYHGTSSRNAELVKRSGFQQSTDGMLGRGVYLSRDPKNCYILFLFLQVQVNVGRVKRINYQRHPLQKTWHDHGYYTAWVPPNCGMVPSGLEEDCVWDPRRIKVLKFKATASPEEEHLFLLLLLLLLLLFLFDLI
uniref:Grass carp reovirus (GCRV)-induced gene 2e n=1 Tax=Neogobius melanostomus TaxID=47308 RepID=A0A8C6U9Z3_9GOBI